MQRAKRLVGWSQDEPWNHDITEALAAYVLRAGKRGFDFYCIYKWRTHYTMVTNERARLLDRNTGRIRNMFFDPSRGWRIAGSAKYEKYYPLELALSAISLAKLGITFLYTRHPLITQQYEKSRRLAGDRFIDPQTGQVLLDLNIDGYVEYIDSELKVPACGRY